MVVRSSIDPKQVFAELLKKDILIRDVSGYPMLSEHFRFSVGRPEENNDLIAALQKIFGVWPVKRDAALSPGYAQPAESKAPLRSAGCLQEASEKNEEN